MDSTKDNPPPGRKRSKVLERIMRAALDEFNRSGLNGVRLEVIAREAGVSKQLIYYYYGSKDTLYEAVLEEYSVIQMAHLLSIDFRAMHPLDAVRIFLEEIMDHFEGIPLGILILEVRPDDATYYRRVSRRDKIIRIFSDIVDRGISQGIFAQSVNKEACFNLAGMMMSGFFVHKIMWRQSQEDFDLDFGVWRDRIIDAVLAVLDRGSIEREYVASADIGAPTRSGRTGAKPPARSMSSS
jgi:AcrR family transcriptional regulator